jgi:hypothetical protein
VVKLGIVRRAAAGSLSPRHRASEFVRHLRPAFENSREVILREFMQRDGC